MSIRPWTLILETHLPSLLILLRSFGINARMWMLMNIGYPLPTRVLRNEYE